MGWIKSFKSKWLRIGFTLTELLIVVIIIGILATLALPMFVKTMEKAKVGEAISNLNLIRTGEKIYFLEYGTFYAPIDTSAENCLNIEWPDSDNAYFDYKVVSGDSSDFEAQAIRKDNAPSGYAGNTYTIKKDGRITGPLL